MCFSLRIKIIVCVSVWELKSLLKIWDSYISYHMTILRYNNEKNVASQTENIAKQSISHKSLKTLRLWLLQYCGYKIIVCVSVWDIKL
jgi:hypothetical protein